MAIKIEIAQLDGTAFASGGTPDQRGVPGKSLLTLGNFKSCTGTLTADVDGKVTFVPDDENAFTAVVEADEA